MQETHVLWAGQVKALGFSLPASAVSSGGGRGGDGVVVLVRVSIIYLSMRLAGSQPVMMVNKMCWSYYGEERSNYNCLKQY